MKAFEIIPATQQYNDEICALLAVPMKGLMHLSKIRKPDFFRGAHIQNECLETYLCRDRSNSKIAGMYSVGTRRVYLNGELKEIKYASDLRVAQEYHGTKAFTYILKYFLGHDAELMQSMVIDDNKKMLELINRVNRDEVLFHYVGKYNCYILPLSTRVKRQRLKGIEIRQATEYDIESMQSYFNNEAKKTQFYPHYNFKKLGQNYYFGLKISNYYIALREGEIVGIAGVWDQSRSCKTLVVDYDKSVKYLRPVINFFKHRLLGGIRLPDIGEYVRNIFLHTILIKDNDEKVFQYLLEVIQNEISQKPYDNLIIGLSENSPFFKVLNGIAPKYVMPANYYVVMRSPHWNNSFAGKDFYFEVARV